MGTLTPAPFNRATASVDDLREALIEDDIENLDPEALWDMVNDNWDQIADFVRSSLRSRYSDPDDVLIEASDRGFFDDDYDPHD
jgi:hypothetical protein